MMDQNDQNRLEDTFHITAQSDLSEDKLMRANLARDQAVKYKKAAKKLVQAIRQHRRNIWGKLAVDYTEDIALYAALDIYKEETT